MLADKVFGSSQALNDWVDHSFGYGGQTRFTELTHEACLELIERCREAFRVHRRRQKFHDMVPRGKRITQ